MTTTTRPKEMTTEQRRAAVLRLMRDGRWRTPTDVAQRLKCSPYAASAALHWLGKCGLVQSEYLGGLKARAWRLAR